MLSSETDQITFNISKSSNKQTPHSDKHAISVPKLVEDAPLQNPSKPSQSRFEKLYQVCTSLPGKHLPNMLIMNN